MFGITIARVRAIEGSASEIWHRHCGGQLPASTRNVISAHGVQLKRLPADSEFEAVFDLSGKHPPYLLSLRQRREDEGESSYRRRLRFTEAHELGHLFLHPELQVVHRESYQTILEAVAAGNFQLAEKEAEANCFASAFLMPSNVFGRDIKGTQIHGGAAWITSLINRYDVSYRALDTRIARLRTDLTLSGYAWADSGVIQSLIPSLELETAIPEIAADAWRCHPQVKGHAIRRLPDRIVNEARSQLMRLQEEDAAAVKVEVDNVSVREILPAVGSDVFGTLFVCGCYNDGRKLYFEIRLV